MNQLLLGGCTRRGLAKDLSCDEGIIRRNCRIAALSGADRAAIENGANPDPLLNRQHCWVERIDDVCRLLRESLDGSVSTDLASNIVWCLCFYEPDLCLHSEMRYDLFQEVDFRVLAKSGWIWSNWMPARWLAWHCSEVSQQNKSLMRLAQDCQAPPGSANRDSFDSEDIIEALIRFIRKLENRTSLINKALDKASQIVRGFDRNRSADIELVDSAKTLSPDVFAVALQDYMQVKNSIPKASRRLVA